MYFKSFKIFGDNTFQIQELIKNYLKLDLDIAIDLKNLEELLEKDDSIEIKELTKSISYNPIITDEGIVFPADFFIEKGKKWRGQKVRIKLEVPEGKTTCSLCSRLRRGILYSNAIKMGVTKIALGHHRDDMLETLFLNMFHNGRLKSMPPKLTSDDGRNVVIRPLAYCAEQDIADYSILTGFPIIPCNLCGSQENLQRQVIKDMFQHWDKQHPGRLETMFRAICNVEPSHLADTNLYDFREGKRLGGKRQAVQTASPGQEPEQSFGRLDVLNI